MVDAVDSISEVVESSAFGIGENLRPKGLPSVAKFFKFTRAFYGGGGEKTAAAMAAGVEYQCRIDFCATRIGFAA